MDLCKTGLCTGCSACANACPEQCIQMAADAEGFLRPKIDSSQCVVCGTCQNVCPVLHPKAHSHETVAYAAVHKDDAIRLESTSGGVFSLLCQWVLDHGGIVFGAAYADDFSVAHGCVEKASDLSKLRTAKYAQSAIGDSYRRAKTFLEQGRYVLFSGTPCQIGGLRMFLGKDYGRLLTVDLICHGVPSPAVWEHYIQYRGEQDAQGERPTSINLRSKESGWAGYSIRFDYAGGQTYRMPNSQDPYLRCFVKDLCLRPSCYACSFKGIDRCSDFTLGDYWGVWSQLPELDDNQGTSIVLLHSEKAKRIWPELLPGMKAVQVDADQCFSENPSALSSATEPDDRQMFLSRYQSEDFSDLADELAPIPIPPKPQTSVTSVLHRAAHKIKRMLGIQ